MSKELSKNSSMAEAAPKLETTPEENELFALFQQMLSAAKESANTRATSKEWANMMKSDHVNTIGPQLKAKTKAVKLQEDFDLLEASKASGITLTGSILGIHSVNPEKSIATWVAEIQFNNDMVNVLIPSYELYHYDLKKYREPGEEQKVHNRMSDMIGSEIEFVVVSIDKKNKTAYASRLAAMAKKSKEYYKKHDSKTEKPRINVGDVVEAKIVCMRAHAIIVDIFGAESVIPGTKTDNRISWEYVNDCHQLFNYNEIITVKILEIKPFVTEKNGTEYKLYQVKASYKDTQENPLETYWDSVQEGELGSAVITGIGAGSVFCKYKNRFTILCAYPERRKTDPYIGQQRKVQITTKRIDPDGTKRVFGIFKDI